MVGAITTFEESSRPTVAAVEVRHVMPTDELHRLRERVFSARRRYEVNMVSHQYVGVYLQSVRGTCAAQSMEERLPVYL